MKFKYLLTAYALLSAVNASAAVIVTFEGHSNSIYSAPISRSGFDFGNTPGGEQHFHEIDSAAFGLTSNGTGVLLNDRDTQIFSRASDLSTFTISTFDAAAAFGGQIVNLTIQGFRNSVLTGTVTVSSLSSFQTISGSALGTVDYVVFDATGGVGQFELDNVVFNAAGAVPEPGTWALLITGFGMVGGALRRRAALATA